MILMKGRVWRSCVVGVLSVALVEVPFATHAQAGMLPTDTAVAELIQSRDREKVAHFFSRTDVRTHLLELGVNPAEAELRLASLTDVEVQKVATQIDQGRSGGEVIVISLTTVLLVVIILILLGKL